MCRVGQGIETGTDLSVDCEYHRYHLESSTSNIACMTAISVYSDY
jgi:hypothetical protein